MRINNLGESIFDSNDIIDIIYQGHADKVSNLIVEQDPEILQFQTALDTVFQKETTGVDQSSFDQNNQHNWAMPQEYQTLDIAAHVLSLCETEQQLQRVGKELLMYQERNMFELLRYLKFLVDRLKSKNIIWGVGRGSSVASYVLYLLGVHRIDSIYYDLDPGEFLR